MDRESFLREYNIDEATFESARISWEELEKIYRNYQAIEPKLRSIGKEFVDRYFYDVEKAGIHSYRYRAKDQGHLLEKIIRKRMRILRNTRISAAKISINLSRI